MDMLDRHHVSKAMSLYQHLISQAGWNRCNLSIYLSIFVPCRSLIAILHDETRLTVPRPSNRCNMNRPRNAVVARACHLS